MPIYCTKLNGTIGRLLLIDTPKEKAMSHIRPESSVSLIVFAAIIVSAFTLFTTFDPAFKQIEVNAAQISTHTGDIEDLQGVQRDYLKHMLEVSSALSRIEGRLDSRSYRDR